MIRIVVLAAAGYVAYRVLEENRALRNKTGENGARDALPKPNPLDDTAEPPPATP